MTRRPSMPRASGAAEPEASSTPALAPLWDGLLDLDAVLDAEPPELMHILPGLLAGTLGMLVSPGGTGKSMLALEIAVGKAAGKDLFGALGGKTEEARVSLLSTEDLADILTRRLHAIGAPSFDPLLRRMLRENLRIKPLHGKGFSLAPGTVAPSRLRPTSRRWRKRSPSGSRTWSSSTP